MKEIVKFDLFGQRRLEFDPDSLTYITKEMYLVPLPGYFVYHSSVKNQAIPYRDVRSIAPIRRKEKWALVTAVLAGALGLYWMFISVGDRGAFVFSAVWFLLLGALPLWLFIRGRLFLAITSDTKAICIPMDRAKKQVRRAIALLKEHCPVEGVRWEI